MLTLWIVPVDEPSFQQTLATPADLSGWDERPDSFPVEARVWGVRTDPEQGSWARNKRNLDKMERGDPIVFYRNETSEYHATGRVGPMTRTEWVRDEYWFGGPALHVYVVEEYDDDLDISNERLNSLLGYKESFWPQGFWRVSDDRPIQRAMQAVGF